MKTIYQKPRKAARRPRQAPRSELEHVPLPRPVSCAVRCPVCRGEALWSSAVSRLAGPPDPLEVKRTKAAVDLKTGMVWHFPQLVPPGHPEAGDGYHNLYRRYFTAYLGVRWCPRCATLEAVKLNWSEEAHFQATVKRTRIFAVDRADWVGIRAYLAAPDRRALYRCGQAPWCVRYLPAAVIAAKNREAFIRAMDAVLRG